jgi:hypothetical protein
MGRGAGAWRHRWGHSCHSYTGPQLEQADGEPARASPRTGAAIPSRTGEPDLDRARKPDQSSDDVTVSGPPSNQRTKNGPPADIRQGRKPGRPLRTDNQARSDRPAVQSLFIPRQSPGTLEVSGLSSGGWTRLVQQSTVT